MKIDADITGIILTDYKKDTTQVTLACREKSICIIFLLQANSLRNNK